MLLRSVVFLIVIVQWSMVWGMPKIAEEGEGYSDDEMEHSAELLMSAAGMLGSSLENETHALCSKISKNALVFVAEVKENIKEHCPNERMDWARIAPNFLGIVKDGWVNDDSGEQACFYRRSMFAGFVLATRDQTTTCNFEAIFDIIVNLLVALYTAHGEQAFNLYDIACFDSRKGEDTALSAMDKIKKNNYLEILKRYSSAYFSMMLLQAIMDNPDWECLENKKISEEDVDPMHMNYKLSRAIQQCKSRTNISDLVFPSIRRIDLSLSHTFEALISYLSDFILSSSVCAKDTIFLAEQKIQPSHFQCTPAFETQVKEWFCIDNMKSKLSKIKKLIFQNYGSQKLVELKHAVTCLNFFNQQEGNSRVAEVIILDLLTKDWREYYNAQTQCFLMEPKLRHSFAHYCVTTHWIFENLGVASQDALSWEKRSVGVGIINGSSSSAMKVKMLLGFMRLNVNLLTVLKEKDAICKVLADKIAKELIFFFPKTADIVMQGLKKCKAPFARLPYELLESNGQSGDPSLKSVQKFFLLMPKVGEMLDCVLGPDDLSPVSDVLSLELTTSRNSLQQLALKLHIHPTIALDYTKPQSDLPLAVSYILRDWLNCTHMCGGYTDKAPQLWQLILVLSKMTNSAGVGLGRVPVLKMIDRCIVQFGRELLPTLQRAATPRSEAAKYILRIFQDSELRFW